MEGPMHLIASAHAEQQLAQLANQFEHWRQSRTTRFEHIPAPLWEQALELSQVLPLAQVAKRLRLRGSDLKKRCGAPPPPGPEEHHSAFSNHCPHPRGRRSTIALTVTGQ